MLKVVAAGLAALLVGGCSDDGDPAAVGGLGLACYPNGTCNVGLECIRGVCVPEGDDEETTPDVTVTQETTEETTPDATVTEETTPDATVTQETTPDATVTQETTPDATIETGPTDTVDVDVAPTTHYYAVIVTDQMQFPNHRSDGGNPCSTSSSRMHGADIDAIGLFDGGNLLAYLDIVDYQEGGICTGASSTLQTDPDEAKGAPDATLQEGSVSLGGGWLAGEFWGGPEILPDYEIEVYESGSAVGGLDEAYEVYLATDLDCAVRESYPWSDCAIFLGEFEGQAEVPGSGD